MRVFNTSSKPIDYRGKVISPAGGFEDYPDMTFVPDRDLQLESSRILSFGKLPNWWLVEKALQAAPKKEAPPTSQRKGYTPPKKPADPTPSGWVEKPIVQKEK